MDIKPIQIDDPNESMGRMLQNAMLMDKLGAGRREREQNALRSRAFAENTQNGVVNDAGVIDFLAKNNGGSAINDHRESVGRQAHLAGQTEHEKMLSEKVRHDATGSFLKNSREMLSGVSDDIKVGPMQKLKMFELLHDDLTTLTGSEERAAQVLGQRVAQLKQAVAGGDASWKQYLANERMGVDKASEQYNTMVNQGPQQVMVQSSRHGVHPPTPVATFKNGVDPRTQYVQAQTNARTAITEGGKDTRLTRTFGQQDVSREDTQGFQAGMQGARFGQQDKTNRNAILARKEAAAEAARVATAKVEHDIKVKADQKRIADTSIAASIIATKLRTRFPEFNIGGVHGAEGDAGWIAVNAMPPVRGGPNKQEWALFKRELEKEGYHFIQGAEGRRSYAVPAGRLDLKTTRDSIKPSATKPPKLVVDPNNRLVEAKVGQEVRGANQSTKTPKRPDFDKRAREAVKMRMSSGMFRPRTAGDLEMATVEAYNDAVAKHNQMTGDNVPFSVPTERTGPGYTTSWGNLSSDAIKWNEWVQKERLRQSQIRKNNAAAERGK